MRHFSPLQLKEYLTALNDRLSNGLSNEQDAPLLLDVREPWEFDYCHIDGSVLIPMGELAYELDNLAEQVGYDREIIMICHHGIRSRQMGYYMEQAGFTHIINLDGGVEQWAEDVDQTMKRY